MRPAREPGGHVQMLLGAYLLGGLSPEEVAEVRAHLDRCVRCRAEHDELSCVPMWLGLVDEPPGAAGPGPGPDDREEDGQRGDLGKP